MAVDANDPVEVLVMSTFLGMHDPDCVEVKLTVMPGQPNATTPEKQINAIAIPFLSWIN